MVGKFLVVCGGEFFARRCRVAGMLGEHSVDELWIFGYISYTHQAFRCLITFGAETIGGFDCPIRVCTQVESPRAKQERDEEPCELRSEDKATQTNRRDDRHQPSEGCHCLAFRRLRLVSEQRTYKLALARFIVVCPFVPVKQKRQQCRHLMR